MIGSSATILRVGKPLPQSIVGQQATIVKMLSDSFPVLQLADGREYIMQLSNLDLKAECSQGLKLWLEARMRHYERIIPRLADKVQHWQLVQSMQAEYEAVLTQLNINDEEVEF